VSIPQRPPMFKASTPSIPVITLVIVLTSTAAASPYKDAVGIEREVGVVEGRATCLDPTVAAARVDDCANSYAECLYRQGQDLEARYQGPNHFDLFVLCRNVVRITHGHGLPPPLNRNLSSGRSLVIRQLQLPTRSKRSDFLPTASIGCCATGGCRGRAQLGGLAWIACDSMLFSRRAMTEFAESDPIFFALSISRADVGNHDPSVDVQRDWSVLSSSISSNTASGATSCLISFS
jgi:hypothetical protein